MSVKRRLCAMGLHKWVRTITMTDTRYSERMCRRCGRVEWRRR